MFESPTMLIPGHDSLPPRAGTQLVTDRFMDETPTLLILGYDKPPPKTGTQPVINRSMYKLMTLPTPVDRHDRLPPRTEPVYDCCGPQQADLMDTVAQLQFEIDALKFVQPGQSTSATRTPPVQPKPAAFTTTKVPKFSGVTSWDQYRQVFDAIICSNGWDDATFALQLLSHLEGDALNVALLVPGAHRATWVGLVRALTEHYGLPGWRIIDASSRKRLGMMGRTHLYSQ